MLARLGQRSAHTKEDTIKRWFIIAPLALAAGLAASGCARVGLTVSLFGVDKTFTASEERLRWATLQTLKRMDIQMKENQPTETGRKIMAQAGDREIQIELDRLTAKTSRMRVNAKQGWLLKDRATATEIIVQTERTLEGEPATASDAASPPVSAQKKSK